MNDETLQDLWDAEVMATPKTRGSCPSPEELLDAVEARGEGVGRDGVLLHLSRCSTCREEAGVVGALLAAADGPLANGGVTAEADEPVRRKGPRGRPWRPLSTAATLVLAAGGAGVLWWGLVGDGSAVRGGDGVLEAPEVSCPAPGAASIRWAGVEGALDYRVELFADDGTVLAERVVTRAEAAAVMPLGADLAPAFGPGAGPVLARVEARFHDGRIMGSPASQLPRDCRPGP